MLKFSYYILLWPLIFISICHFYIKYHLELDNLPTMEDLVDTHRYSIETYDVETDDGYILALYRIGKKDDNHRNGSAVFLQHGTASSSSIFVSAGPERSLSFILADRGYDVWLGNSRGNSHSRRHRTLDIDSSEYWDFSYHEMGHQDLKAMVDTALKVSGQEKLDYIGHSLGNHLLLVLLTTRPEYSQKIKQGIMLAPAVYLKDTKFSSGYYFSHYFAKWRVKFGHSNWFSMVDSFGKLLYSFCAPDHHLNYLCYLAYLSYGPSTQVNEPTVQVALSTGLSSTSMKLFAHLALNSDSDMFERMYPDTNQQTVYDLNLVTTPMTLIYSKNDYLSFSRSVKRLHSELPNSTIYEVPCDGFNHLDFLFGKDVVDLVYKEVIHLLERN